MKTFYIISEFPKYNDDNEEDGEQDFGGEAWGYCVKLDGKVLADFGDYYHDKGFEKSEAYIEGYTDALELTDFEIKQENGISE